MTGPKGWCSACNIFQPFSFPMCSVALFLRLNAKICQTNHRSSFILQLLCFYLTPISSLSGYDKTFPVFPYTKVAAVFCKFDIFFCIIFYAFSYCLSSLTKRGRKFASTYPTAVSLARINLWILPTCSSGYRTTHVPTTYLAICKMWTGAAEK